jgi:hypothetical protein
MRRHVDGDAVSSLTVRKTGAKSEITVEKTQDSGAPMAGKFRIKCALADEDYDIPAGAAAPPVNPAERDCKIYPDLCTKGINWNASIHDISRAVNEQCPKMRDRVMVYDKPYHHGETYQYLSNPTIGRAFYLHFRGYNADPGQFGIESYPDDPLTGTDVSFQATTDVEYNNNLLWEPIPFEMLETYETLP